MKNPRVNFLMSCLILLTLSSGIWRFVWSIMALWTLLIIFVESLPSELPMPMDSYLDAIDPDYKPPKSREEWHGSSFKTTNDKRVKRGRKNATKA